MRLYREMGIMTLDPDGQWIEQPLSDEDDARSAADDESTADGIELLPPALPPEVPAVWLEPIDRTDSPESSMRTVGHFVSEVAPPRRTPGSPRVLRLPPIVE